MSAAHPYNQLLLAFWRQRDREAPWGRRALFALALLGLALGVYLVPPFAVPLLAVSAAVMLMSLWMAVIGSLMRQNHPHVARCVPGHLRQTLESALVSWVTLARYLRPDLSRTALGPVANSGESQPGLC